MTNDAREEYAKAYRQARITYYRQLARGRSGFIPAMEDLIPPGDIASEYPVGLESVPLRKIVGTWTRSRAKMFTLGFRPLASSDKSEFGQKWCTLYSAHIRDGIREPVKLYEYMNWYYVIEGNKRLSVLNHVGAGSIEAETVRLLPRRSPMTPGKALYFAYLDFRSETELSQIWMTRASGFADLVKVFRDPPFDSSKSEFLKYYLTFRTILHKIGGQRRLRYSTGDVFLRYAKVFGIPDISCPVEWKDDLERLIEEMSGENPFVADESIAEEIVKEAGGLFSPSAFFRVRKRPRVVFFHARSEKLSGWTAAHETGRRHIQSILKEQIRTSSVVDVPEDESAFDAFSKAVEKGAQVVFATSPLMEGAVIKASLRYPRTVFYLCSPGRSYSNVQTYTGQAHEPNFLTGVLAALLERERPIGYIATGTGGERYARINSFVQGVRLVRPDARVPLLWNRFWDHPEHSRNMARQLFDRGCDILFQHEMRQPGQSDGQFGLYGQSAEGDMRHFASVEWDWGLFYQRIMENTLAAGRTGIRNPEGPTPLPFWGGLRSGLVDLLMNDEFVPMQTVRLISLMRRSIIERKIHPLDGPVRDRNGQERIAEGHWATPEVIREMNWLCEGVEDLGD